MEMLFLNARSLPLLCSCQLVCKKADLRNRACWTSFHKAGFVCMVCCRHVLSHMEANCSMNWTWAPEVLSCKLADHWAKNPYSVFLLFGFTFGLMWMSLAASFCYLHAAHVNLEWQNTFDVVLTEINVIRTRSAQIALAGLGKKERAIKADRWGAEKRFWHNPNDISMEGCPVFLLFVPRCVLSR